MPNVATQLARSLVLVGLLVGCGGNGGGSKGPSGAHGPAVTPVKKDVGEKLAEVGSSYIGTDEFKRQATRTQPADGKALSAEERREVLDELVTEEVLFQEAMKQGLYQDPKVRKILVNLLLRKDVYASVSNDDFTEDELLAYYEAHKEEFVVAEKVQLKRIVLKITPARDDAATQMLADRIHRELAGDPRLFAELAAEHSDGPYKRRGGDLGFVSKEGKPGIDDAIIAKAFTMKVDELAPPMKADGTWQILSVVNRRERVERSFSQMKGSVLRMVKQDRYKSLTDQYIEEAKSGKTIAIDEEKLDAVDLSRPSRPSLPRDAAADMPGPPSAKPAPGGDGHEH